MFIGDAASGQGGDFPVLLRDLIVKLRKQCLADSTVRQVFTVLRAGVDDAQLDGLIIGVHGRLLRRLALMRSGYTCF